MIREQLLYEGIVSSDSFFRPTSEYFDRDYLCVHDESYYNRLKQLGLSKGEERAIGFPVTKSLIDREVQIANGTIECTKYALEHGIAMNVAGGTHHAFTNRGEGFCLLNDQAIAAQKLIDLKLSEKVVIIDLDVHQGNGSAQIFQENNHVITVSFHGAKNYPLRKESSNYDVEFDDGTSDEEYLQQLSSVLSNVLEVEKPDFAFYQAGVDVLQTDKLGRLNLSIEGCAKRDEFVLQSLSLLEVPVVICMGGGYSSKLRDILDAHINTYKIAYDLIN